MTSRDEACRSVNKGVLSILIGATGYRVAFRNALGKSQNFIKLINAHFLQAKAGQDRMDKNSAGERERERRQSEWEREREGQGACYDAGHLVVNTWT